MFTDLEKQSIKKSWRLVVPIADTAAERFYRRVFELRPDYAALFAGDLAAHKRNWIHILAFTVKSLDFSDAQWKESVDPSEDLLLVLLLLGRRNEDLGKLMTESEAVISEALTETFAYALGDAFTEEVRVSWARLTTLLWQTLRLSSTAIESTDPSFAEQSELLGQRALLEQLAEAGTDQGRLGWEEQP